MMNEQLSVKQVKDVVLGIADTVGKTKRGTIVVRRGFFYTNGMNSQKFADGVVAALAKSGITVTLVDSGEKWAAFRGGATVAQGSHFWAEFK